MVEIVSISQMLNALKKCALTMTVMVKSYAQIEVSKFQNGYSFEVVIKISGEFSNGLFLLLSAGREKVLIVCDQLRVIFYKVTSLHMFNHR